MSFLGSFLLIIFQFDFFNISTVVIFIDIFSFVDPPGFENFHSVLHIYSFISLFGSLFTCFLVLFISCLFVGHLSVYLFFSLSVCFLLLCLFFCQFVMFVCLFYLFVYLFTCLIVWVELKDTPGIDWENGIHTLTHTFYYLPL